MLARSAMQAAFRTVRVAINMDGRRAMGVQHVQNMRASIVPSFEVCMLAYLVVVRYMAYLAYKIHAWRCVVDWPSVDIPC